MLADGIDGAKLVCQAGRIDVSTSGEDRPE